MKRTTPAAGADVQASAPAADASRIFISYRRLDAKHAARALYERLGEHFGAGHVFMDLHDIEGGADFFEVICHVLETCGTVVVVIGEHWLTAKDEEGGRRLDNPKDYVRMEVARALARGAFVVPVLVDGAKMPDASDLPDDLKPLARFNAEVLSDHNWVEDVERLIRTTDDGRTVNCLLRQWRRRPVRVTVAALALAAALFAQYQFVYRPQPVSLASTGLFSPVVARHGLEELVIERPETDSAEGLLFSHHGGADEFVDLFFARARLGDETRDLLVALDADPPREPAALSLETLRPRRPPDAEEMVAAVGPASGAAGAGRPGGARAARGETCHTSVDIRAAQGRALPAALHLYQLEQEDSERVRQFNLRAEGGDLRVGVQTVVPDEGTPDSLGCRKHLSVGDTYEDFFNGTITVHAVAEAGGSLRLSFSGRRGDLFRPFELGAGTPKLNGPAPLRAAAVYRRPLGDNPSTSQHRTLVARAAGSSPLNINSVEVGPDQIQLNVSGWALVKTGKVNFVNLAERFKRQPSIVALFIIVDLALLTWLLLLLFGARRRHA